MDIAAPAPELGATSVVETVEADRAASVASALASAASGVLRVLIVVAALRLTGALPAVPPLPALVWAGAGLGLGWWLHRRGGGAWMRFALTRAALAVRGRTPHRLLAFLAYAETVGLLRDGAGAYPVPARSPAEPTRRRVGERATGQPAARGAGCRTCPRRLLAGGVWRLRRRHAGTGREHRARRRPHRGGAAPGTAGRGGCGGVDPAGEPAGTCPTTRRADAVGGAAAADRPADRRRRTGGAQLIVAAEELSHGAIAVTLEPASATRPAAPGAQEFLAVLHHVNGDNEAARARLDLLRTAASQDVGEPAPIGAGLLAALLVHDSEPATALVVCHQELLLADQPPDRVDLLLLAEAWRWSVEVMRRNTDERAELRRRIRAVLTGRREHPRRIGASRRELAELGLQLCHAVIEHQTLGPLAVAASDGWSPSSPSPPSSCRPSTAAPPCGTTADGYRAWTGRPALGSIVGGGSH